MNTEAGASSLFSLNSQDAEVREDNHPFPAPLPSSVSHGFAVLQTDCCQRGVRRHRLNQTRTFHLALF